MTITAIDAAGPGLSSGVPLFTNPRRDRFSRQSFERGSSIDVRDLAPIYCDQATHLNLRCC